MTQREDQTPDLESEQHEAYAHAAADALAKVAESVLDRYLQLDPSARARLDQLTDTVVAVQLRGYQAMLYFHAEEARLRVRSTCEREPDAIITATALGLVDLARQGSGSSFDGDVTIVGDVEAGQRLHDVLAGVEIDWEEQASRYLGDVIAHRLGSIARQTLRWSQDSARSLAQDTSEYLTEESELTPRKREVAAFLHAVDKLRSDVDRLAARLDRLERRLGTAPQAKQK